MGSPAVVESKWIDVGEPILKMKAHLNIWIEFDEELAVDGLLQSRV